MQEKARIEKQRRQTGQQFDDISEGHNQGFLSNSQIVRYLCLFDTMKDVSGTNSSIREN
jgi:hypothetical protein